MKRLTYEYNVTGKAYLFINGLFIDRLVDYSGTIQLTPDETGPFSTYDEMDNYTGNKGYARTFNYEIDFEGEQGIGTGSLKENQSRIGDREFWLDGFGVSGCYVDKENDAYMPYDFNSSYPRSYEPNPSFYWKMSTAEQSIEYWKDNPDLSVEPPDHIIIPLELSPSVSTIFDNITFYNEHIIIPKVKIIAANIKD